MRQLRGDLLRAMGVLGNDPVTQERARELYARQRTGGGGGCERAARAHRHRRGERGRGGVRGVLGALPRCAHPPGGAAVSLRLGRLSPPRSRAADARPYDRRRGAEPGRAIPHARAARQRPWARAGLGVPQGALGDDGPRVPGQRVSARVRGHHRAREPSVGARGPGILRRRAESSSAARRSSNTWSSSGWPCGSRSGSRRRSGRTSVGRGADRSAEASAHPVSLGRRVPRSTTGSQAQAIVFGAGASVTNFFYEASYQQTSLTGNVFGPYTISISSTGCDYYGIAMAAEQAATAAGVSLSSYARRVYAFPSNGCGWWGLGTVGGYPSMAWINGSFQNGVVAHEMGHNLGLYHSTRSSAGPPPSRRAAAAWTTATSSMSWARPRRPGTSTRRRRSVSAGSGTGRRLGSTGPLGGKAPSHRADDFTASAPQVVGGRAAPRSISPGVAAATRPLTCSSPRGYGGLGTVQGRQVRRGPAMAVFRGRAPGHRARGRG